MLKKLVLYSFFFGLSIIQWPASAANTLPSTASPVRPKTTALTLTQKARILPPVTPQAVPTVKTGNTLPLDPQPLKPLAPLKGVPVSKLPSPARGRQMLTGVSHLIDRTKDTLQQKGPIATAGGILILPILHHGKEKAFFDVALPIANALADQLAGRINNPQLLAFPSATLAEIEAAGLRPLYEQLSEQVDSSGRPDARLQQDLIEQLLASPSSSLSAESGGHLAPVQHVIWVTADADLSHPTQAASVWERFHRLAGDNLPQDANLFVSAGIRIFQTGNGLLLTSQKQAKTSVPMRRFMNVTPSVYQDRDSTQAFNTAGRQLASKLLGGLSPSALGSAVTAGSAPHFSGSHFLGRF